MATATLPDVSNDLALKTEQIEYRVYTKVDEHGNAVLDADKNPVRELVSGEKQFELKDKEGSGYTEELRQSVRSYRLGSLEGITGLIPDESEAVAIFNRGLAQKFQQKIRAAFLEVKDDKSGQLAFEPVNGVFDPIDLLREETQRRNLAPSEKAERIMRNAGYSEAKIAQALAVLMAND